VSAGEVENKKQKKKRDISKKMRIKTKQKTPETRRGKMGEQGAREINTQGKKRTTGGTEEKKSTKSPAITTSKKTKGFKPAKQDNHKATWGIVTVPEVNQLVKIVTKRY